MVLIKVSLPLAVSIVLPRRLERPPGWPGLTLAELGSGEVLVLRDGRTDDGQYSLPEVADVGAEVADAEADVTRLRSELVIAESRVRSARSRLSQAETLVAAASRS